VFLESRIGIMEESGQYLSEADSSPVCPEARTKEALLEAIGAAISALSARDARGYFEHCGYRASVQSLW
jgi:hypothetical protein